MDLINGNKPHPSRGEGGIILSRELSSLIFIARTQLKLIMGDEEENTGNEMFSSDDYQTEPETDGNLPKKTKKQTKRKRKTIRNSDGYTFPKKTNKKSKATTTATKQIETSNIFETLNNKENEVVKENENLAENNEASGSQEHNKQNVVPKQVKPPPIVITQKVDFIKLSQKINPSLKEGLIVAYTSQGIRVNTKTLDDHKAAIFYLDSLKIQYFTYPTQLDKIPKVVLKGLPPETDEQQIINELNLCDFFS